MKRLLIVSVVLTVVACSGPSSTSEISKPQKVKRDKSSLPSRSTTSSANSNPDYGFASLSVDVANRKSYRNDGSRTPRNGKNGTVKPADRPRYEFGSAPTINGDKTLSQRFPDDSRPYVATSSQGSPSNRESRGSKGDVQPSSHISRSSKENKSRPSVPNKAASTELGPIDVPIRQHFEDDLLSHPEAGPLPPQRLETNKQPKMAKEQNYVLPYTSQVSQQDPSNNYVFGTAEHVDPSIGYGPHKASSKPSRNKNNRILQDPRDNFDLGSTERVTPSVGHGSPKDVQSTPSGVIYDDILDIDETNIKPHFGYMFANELRHRQSQLSENTLDLIIKDFNLNRSDIMCENTNEISDNGFGFIEDKIQNESNNLTIETIRAMASDLGKPLPENFFEF